MTYLAMNESCAKSRSTKPSNHKMYLKIISEYYFHCVRTSKNRDVPSFAIVH